MSDPHAPQTKPHLVRAVAPGPVPLLRARLAGISIPLERRREIYAICRQHDIVIIEDDPYFYLQWDLQVYLMGLAPDPWARNSQVSACSGRPAGRL